MKIPQRFQAIGLDEFAIMPNHLHGIIYLGKITDKNHQELDRIRQYIINNPIKWEIDEENPDHND
jgi:REP element-mobilizing transposase RayT